LSNSICFFYFFENEKVQGIMIVIVSFSAIVNAYTVQEIHMLRCLTYISQRYFAPGRSLVISSPSNYRDVQQELIADIHLTAIWPVVVSFDDNISKPNKTGLIDKDGSYFILITDGNTEHFLAEINGLAFVGRKFTRIWNAEARFFVAGTIYFSVFQQMYIFDLFSRLRIYNCIITSQENYVINKEYMTPINVNNVDTGIKLGVYTWFPYQTSDRCTAVNYITLLDSWVTSTQGHFTQKTDLFPVKITNNLNKCPMKVVVRNGRWHFTTVYVKHQ
jgi:hypothetical protein